MSSDKVILGYWNIRGLGHPIRFLLRYMGVEYEEKLYELTPELTKDNWYADRDKLNLDFPNLPYIIDGTVRLTETTAIMRYLCRTRKPELLGTTIESQTHADMIQNFVGEMVDGGLVPVCYSYTPELEKSYRETAPKKLHLLSKFLGEKPWFTGEELTWVDFFVHEYLHPMRVYDSKVFDEFPNIQACLKRFEELPAIKAYMESKEFIKAPCFLQCAIVKI